MLSCSGIGTFGHGWRREIDRHRARRVSGHAVASTRLLEAYLYGVAPRDPLTFGMVGVMIAAVAVLAAYGPARRAARVDPMIVLRAE